MLGLLVWTMMLVIAGEMLTVTRTDINAGTNMSGEILADRVLPSIFSQFRTQRLCQNKCCRLVVAALEQKSAISCCDGRSCSLNLATPYLSPSLVGSILTDLDTHWFSQFTLLNYLTLTRFKCLSGTRNKNGDSQSFQYQVYYQFLGR